MYRNRVARAVVRMKVRRVPVPGTKVTKADVHTVGSVVPRHEPPNVRVVVPARMHEDIVHTLDDAVPVHPEVLTIAVGPVPVDPNSFGTTQNGLLHHDGPRRWWRCLRSGDGLRLLHDDHRLAVDLLGRPGFGLDDHVRRRVVRLARLRFTQVAIVRDIELIAGRGPIAVRTLVIGRRGNGGRRRDRQYEHHHESNEQVHRSSLICTSSWSGRHPRSTEPARPARQSAKKVLGFPRF